MNPPETFETARLLLRPAIKEDAHAIFEKYAQDTRVTRYLSWLPHKSIDETYAYLARYHGPWNERSVFLWALIRKEDDQFTGALEARINGHQMSLGYVLAQSEWGKGYMPEAVRAVIDWAMTQPDIYRIWAVCDVENPASARVMEKVGMEREGILRRWLRHPATSDEPRDCYCYSIVK
jgi:RimJ/RimL family protein N-acetyltransferase